MECSYGVAIITKLFIILSFVAFTRGLANPETDPDHSDALDVAVAYLKSNPLILNNGGDPYIYIQVPIDNHGNDGRQPQPVIDIHLPEELFEEILNSQNKEKRINVNDGPYIDIQVPYEPYVDIRAPYTHPGYNYGYQQNLYVPTINPYIQQQNGFAQQQYLYGQPQNSYVHQEIPYVHQENPYVHQENPYVHQEKPYVHEESPYIYEDVPYVHEEVPDVDEATPQKHGNSYIDIEYTIRVQADDLQAASEEYSLPAAFETKAYSASEEYSIPADPMLAYAMLTDF